MAVTVKPAGIVYLRLFSKLEAENKEGFDYPASERPDGLQNAHLRPGVPYFAGRVISFTTRPFQTAPDVWTDDRIVTVAFDDGSTEDVNLGPVDQHATYELDASPELLSKVQTRAALVAKLTEAVEVAERLADAAKPILKKGKKALAIKGRKVAIGTEVEVFWAGTTYNKFSHTHEERLGVVLPNGAKEWVSASNFQPLPTPAEVANYGRALKDLEQAKKALENPTAHREPVINEGSQETPEARYERLFALIPPRVLVREMVRDAFGDDAVAEHERLHEAEYQQEVQIGDG